MTTGTALTCCSSQMVAQSRAAAISETFQRQFDAEVLEREHPGEPALVYFDLSPSEDTDVDGLVKNVVSLAGAGWKAAEHAQKHRAHDLRRRVMRSEPASVLFR